jgi:hypothetical protein
MTSKQDIAAWFDEGVSKGASHMLVICDTFDHEDYPVFVNTASECLQKYKSPGEMQRVMEVYDLQAHKEQQLSERRAMRLPITVSAIGR